jgi:NTE family protein
VTGATHNGAVTNGESPPVAVVLPGGGARGAYEAGALGELLPALEARGERVSIFCGTSVGAINAAQLASLADRSAREATDATIERWLDMRKGDVIRRVVGPALPLTALRFLGETLEVPGMSLAGLLDPSPLAGSLDRWIDWDGLHDNAASGRVRAACVVATSLEHGRPVAFVESGRSLPDSNPRDGLRFCGVRLRGEHVRASAAIPLLFPPVEVSGPKNVAGHYIDGGTRLNTPIEPALALGAQKVIVIGFEPFAGRARTNGTGVGVRLADIAANVIDGLLVDQVADDLNRLVAINSFFAEDASAGPSPAARNYRRSRGRPPYRKISYALVAPSSQGAIGAIAEDVFQRRYSGLRGLRAPDYPFLSRLVGGRSRSRGELLSFLMFDPEFTSALVDLGRADARAWLDRHPGFWCSDPAHDFDFPNTHSTQTREEDAIDEFRRLRRV